jgi:hypothetical protein
MTGPPRPVVLQFKVVLRGVTAFYILHSRGGNNIDSLDYAIRIAMCWSDFYLIRIQIGNPG